MKLTKSVALLATLVVFDVQAQRLDGYATVSRSGSTLISSASAAYTEETALCSGTCASRLSGTHHVDDTSVGAVLNVNWFTGEWMYRKQETRTIAPGQCFTATNTAEFRYLSGSPTGVSPFSSYPTVVASDSWVSGTICYTTTPSPTPPPPVEVCDHCDNQSIVNEPLILDLEGDGIPTTNMLIDPVSFDLNDDGIKDNTAWTVAGAEDAFLVVDWNRNGVIDGGTELFGDAAILPNGQRAAHGYEVLGACDDPLNGGNGDGTISHRDAIWPRLRLWVDRNHDGMMSNDESYTLASKQVREISLKFAVRTSAENYGVDASGNYHVAHGSYVRRVDREDRALAIHEIYFLAGRN